MPDLTFPILDSNDQLDSWDDDINSALAQIRGHFPIDGTVTNPIAYQDFLDTDDDTLYQRNAGNNAWIKRYSLGTGKPIYWCDDSGTPKIIGLKAPATLTDEYEVVWPVDIATTGEALRVASVTSGVLQMEWFSPGAGASTLAGLSDVDTTGVADGDVLTYDSAGGEWIAAAASGGGASALDDLSDAAITSPADRHVLIYDTTDFVNRALVAADLPDLSATYLVVGSDLGDLNNVSDVGVVAGELLAYNGSAYVNTNTPTLVDQGTLSFQEDTANGTLTVTVQAAADMTGSASASSYTITLPAKTPAIGDTVTGDHFGLAVNASGVADWVAMTGSGGRIVRDGGDSTSGNSGTLLRPTLILPTIDRFQGMTHTHDGSAGLPYPPGVTDGDGSNTLDLFWAAKLPANGGNAIPVEVGGTGLSSITAGALMVAGAAGGETYPANHDGVTTAENASEAYTAMVALLGGAVGHVVQWDGSAWGSAALSLADLSDVAPGGAVAGSLLAYSVGAGDFVATNTLVGDYVIDGNLSVRSSATAGGAIAFFEYDAIGTNKLTIQGPASIATDFQILLPSVVGSTGQALRSTVTGSNATLGWANPIWADLGGTIVASVTLGGFVTHVVGSDAVLSVHGALKCRDLTGSFDAEIRATNGSLSANRVLSLPDETGTLATRTNIRTNIYAGRITGVDGAKVSTIALAPVGATVTGIRAYVTGSGGSVTFNVTIDGADALDGDKTVTTAGGAQIYTGGGLSTTSIAAGDVIAIDIASGTADEIFVSVELAY